MKTWFAEKPRSGLLKRAGRFSERIVDFLSIGDMLELCFLVLRAGAMLLHFLAQTLLHL